MGKEEGSRYDARGLAMEPGERGHPVPPLPAASVILLRARGQGFQVLLARRGEGTDFARQAFVFPGGTVEPGDREVELPGFDLQQAAQALSGGAEGGPGSEAEARAIWAAALRELEEEVGIRLPASALTYFSRWITPEALPRRFDTHFFLATAPQGEIALNPAEHTEARWLEPSQALSGHARGEVPLVFPTLRHLEALARFQTLEELLAFAARRRVTAPTLPRLVEEGGRQVLLLPPDADGLW